MTITARFVGGPADGEQSRDWSDDTNYLFVTETPLGQAISVLPFSPSFAMVSGSVRVDAPGGCAVYRRMRETTEDGSIVFRYDADAKVVA